MRSVLDLVCSFIVEFIQFILLTLHHFITSSATLCFDAGIEDIKQLAAFARKEMASKSRDMSTASTQFAQDLVAGLGILVKLEDVNKEAGDIAEPTAYSWTRKTIDGDTVKNGEHQGTRGARNWFRTNFLSPDLEKEGYVCTVVTGHYLPMLTAGGLAASGKGDMVIGNKTSMQYADSVCEQAAGLIELKTDEYPIKVGQMILELTAFSMISRFGRAVVLLASDCNTKWRLVWFQDYITICRRNYVSGRKCWMNFQEMIKKAEERSAAMRLWYFPKRNASLSSKRTKWKKLLIKISGALTTLRMTEAKGC